MTTRKRTVSLTLTMLVALTVAVTVPLIAAGPDEDDGTVYNYAIISVTQTGANQLTVRVQADFCSACNPNTVGNPGCTAFSHGYPGPPPYTSTTHWCWPSNVDGRYVAVQLGSGGSVIGSTKFLCDPTNWPLDVLPTPPYSYYQKDIVVTGTLSPGSTVTVEADIYCSWCGHYYPTPVSTTVAALTSIVVTPPSATLPIGTTQGFTATGYDSLGNPIPINPTWSVTGGIGAVSPTTGPSTTFTGTAAGTGTVVASVGSVSGSANPVTVYIPNSPPVANAGPDQTLEQTSHAGAQVTLDGSGSTDDGQLQPLTYTWTWSSGSASGVNPTVTLPLGTTTVTLTVYDGQYSDSDTVDITVQDTTVPTISVSVTPNVLWPPNHKYVDVVATVVVSDICDPNPTITLVSVTSNEPDNANGVGDGNTVNDIVIVDDYNFKLRAERDGTGTGRVYTIEYKVTDASGNEATGTATVTVPHDKGN